MFVIGLSCVATISIIGSLKSDNTFFFFFAIDGLIYHLKISSNVFKYVFNRIDIGTVRGSENISTAKVKKKFKIWRRENVLKNLFSNRNRDKWYSIRFSFFFFFFKYIEKICGLHKRSLNIYKTISGINDLVKNLAHINIIFKKKKVT